MTFSLVPHPFEVHFFKDGLALEQRLKANLFIGIGEDSVQALHFDQLCLLVPVPRLLQLPDHPVEEGDVVLQRLEFDSVGIHPEIHTGVCLIYGILT